MKEIKLSKLEARALIHWLDLVNGNWKGGSYENIEDIFNKLASFADVRKHWIWK